MVSPDIRGFSAVTRRHVADGRRSVLTWAGSLGVLGAFMAAIHPSISSSLDEVSDKYPPALKEAFGVQDIGTIEGYLHVELFSLLVPLAVGFFAMRTMAAGLANAEERGYLDTVLSLPLPRRSLLGGVYAATLAATAVMLVGMGAVTFAVARLAGTGLDLGPLGAALLGTWSLAAFGAGAGALACGGLHRGRSVIGAGMGTLVAMYLLDLAGRLSEPLEPLRWISAFRYYGSPMLDGAGAGLLILVATGMILAFVGAALFERRDVL